MKRPRMPDRAFHSDVPAVVVVVPAIGAVGAPAVVVGFFELVVSGALAAGWVPARAGLEVGYAPAVDHVLLLGDVVAQ